MMRVLREGNGLVSRAELLAPVENNEQAQRALATLVADGLVVRRGSHYSLPD
jgi:hypothetical protein